MKLTPRWSNEVDDDVAGGLAHGAGLARGDGVEPFHWLCVLGWRAWLDGFLYAVDGLGSPPSSSPSSSTSSSGGRRGVLRAVETLVIGSSTGPTDRWSGTIGCVMVCRTIARGAVTVSLDPQHLLCRLGRAVRVPAASCFRPRVGFLVTVGGYRHAGGGG